MPDNANKHHARKFTEQDKADARVAAAPDDRGSWMRPLYVPYIAWRAASAYATWEGTTLVQVDAWPEGRWRP